MSRERRTVTIKPQLYWQWCRCCYRKMRMITAQTVSRVTTLRACRTGEHPTPGNLPNTPHMSPSACRDCVGSRYIDNTVVAAAMSVVVQLSGKVFESHRTREFCYLLDFRYSVCCYRLLILNVSFRSVLLSFDMDVKHAFVYLKITLTLNNREYPYVFPDLILRSNLKKNRS